LDPRKKREERIREKNVVCVHIDIKPIYDEDKDMGSNSKHVLNPWKFVAQ
jgi:hypothetical protein